MKRAIGLFLLILTVSYQSFGSQILIPMDHKQQNHLKAYGIAFWILEHDLIIDWLINYRGGSFLVPHMNSIEEQLIIRGVTYEVVADAQANKIKQDISDPQVNMHTVQLETAPKVAVYTPSGKQPWDDAVTLVLTYAEIPYDEIYDSTVVKDGLVEYDWLHLHHEDFTGQYGKFYRNYKNAPWYKKQVADSEARAAQLGFEKVSELKLAVTEKIKTFVAGGGFLFTMCSGTDSFDIAQAAKETDICESMFDGDPADPQAQSKLDFDQCLAFKDFKLETNPLEYEFSSIDGSSKRAGNISEAEDKFTLFEFSAKWDIVPALLTQNHTQIIDGFMGQTTDFKKENVKSDVTIMGETKSLGTVRYIHGELGQGTWTFYGGHDPEDYRHYVGDPHTDLDLYPNSPGYRLILNNILFPAAKKIKRKT